MSVLRNLLLHQLPNTKVYSVEYIAPTQTYKPKVVSNRYFDTILLRGYRFFFSSNLFPSKLCIMSRRADGNFYLIQFHSLCDVDSIEFYSFNDLFFKYILETLEFEWEYELERPTTYPRWGIYVRCVYNDRWLWLAWELWLNLWAPQVPC